MGLLNDENRGDYILLRNIEGENIVAPKNKSGWNRYIFQHHHKTMRLEDMARTHIVHVPLEEEIFAKSFDGALADLSRMGYHEDIYNFSWIKCESCNPGDIIVLHGLKGERLLRKVDSEARGLDVFLRG